MIESGARTGHQDDVPDEDLAAIFGTDISAESALPHEQRKRSFMPWHHPVKQIVRKHQWAALTAKLIEQGTAQAGILRYFTLPGPDLLDVRVLADVCAPKRVRIEYFGFDASAEREDSQGRSSSATGGAATTVESALRQAGRITDEAIILPDRLEDIAMQDSQAYGQLRQRPPFDVINIDACDHLAYYPHGRTTSMFDALGALLKHQMVARAPWLLFVTTRTEPHLLGNPGFEFQRAIMDNLRVAPELFGSALASVIKADSSKLTSALNFAWGRHDSDFLKLYSIGLGKFLLHFFNGQPNHPANVQLASAYAYRVHNDEPDMLALAFRIIPDGPRALRPSAGGATVIPDLEPRRATYVVAQAEKLQDLDHALEAEPDIRKEAIDGTEALLKSANYDVAEWRRWVETHKRRPVKLDEPSAAM